jgi:hypothetical protein
VPRHQQLTGGIEGDGWARIKRRVAADLELRSEPLSSTIEELGEHAAAVAVLSVAPPSHHEAPIGANGNVGGGLRMTGVGIGDELGTERNARAIESPSENVAEGVAVLASQATTNEPSGPIATADGP